MARIHLASLTPGVGIGHISKPSIPAMKLPKIRAIHIRPSDNGGFQVKHIMSAGHPKQFVFASPAKMLSHLNRIEHNQWLHPMQDTAPALAHALDIGPMP